jgi:hypothetical protein
MAAPHLGQAGRLGRCSLALTNCPVAVKQENMRPEKLPINCPGVVLPLGALRASWGNPIPASVSLVLGLIRPSKGDAPWPCTSDWTFL